jgi:hypothetical protein
MPSGRAAWKKGVAASCDRRAELLMSLLAQRMEK